MSPNNRAGFVRFWENLNETKWKRLGLDVSTLFIVMEFWLFDAWHFAELAHMWREKPGTSIQTARTPADRVPAHDTHTCTDNMLAC